MKNIIIICIALLLFSCGSKKKITDIKKGYEYSRVEEKKTSEDISKVSEDNISQGEKKVTEKEKEKIIEKYIFDDQGRVKEYTKETNRDSERNSEEKWADSVKKLIDLINKKTEQKDSVGEKKDYVKNVDLEKKSSHPIWNWIGFGLLIVIVGLAVWKFVLKR